MGLFDEVINGIKVLVTTGGVRTTFDKAYESDIWVDEGIVKVNTTNFNIVDGMTTPEILDAINIRKNRLKKIKKLMK